MRPYRILILVSLLFIAACGTDKPQQANTPSNQPATKDANSGIPTPKTIVYQLINQYPHSSTAYTEGLQFVDGYMYEGTGQYGNTYLSKTELESGKVVKQIKLDNQYFGEGITVMGNKIYQLTYKAKKGFVYDRASFKLLNTFNYNTTTGEGWGMTNDSTSLIFSDGTDALYFYNPATLKEEKQLKVRDNYGPVGYINELEYINGYIYANQWQTDWIIKIDPATGYVVAKANLSNLRQRTGIPQPTGDESQPELLNGIAYDATKNRILITGKNWPKIFEIKLDN